MRTRGRAIEELDLVQGRFPKESVVGKAELAGLRVVRKARCWSDLRHVRSNGGARQEDAKLLG